MPHYWVKVGNEQEVEIECNDTDNVNKLKKNIKEELHPKFENFPVDEIIVKKQNGEVLSPKTKISEVAVANSDETYFFVDAPTAPASQANVNQAVQNSNEGYPNIDLCNEAKRYPCSSINEALAQELQFKIPTTTSSYINRWPDIFVRAEGDSAIHIDMWLSHQICGQAEVAVMSLDFGWIYIIESICNAVILRDQASESSTLNTRPDATATVFDAVVLKHEAKFKASSLSIAKSELTEKLFDGVQNLFPLGSLEIIGVVTSATNCEIHRIYYDTDDRSFHTDPLENFNVNSIESRVRFIVTIIKLCRWIITCRGPNKGFHLYPGVRTETSNGHHVTWIKEGILKEFRMPNRKRRNDNTLTTGEQIEKICKVHELKLRHVEWGYKHTSGSVIITRVGYRLKDALRNELTNKKKVMEDVKAGLEELHQNGFAHGDIRIENVFVDHNGITFLDDLEYLTSIGEPARLESYDGITVENAKHLDMLMFNKFAIELMR